MSARQKPVLAAVPRPTPRRVGPFELLEQVATRPFTATYRAKQAPLGRTVLIKTLKPTVSAASPFAAELAREALVLGRLDQEEGVTRLHDFVQTDAAAYLVLEDARAVSLAELVARQRGEPDVEVVSAIALATARALARVHERGVIHGAIGTSSIQLAPPGRILLASFHAAVASTPELAAPLDGGEAGESRDDVSFLAPEQILGEPVTPRADVWATGVVLHTLLTGESPFGADLHDLSKRIRTSPPASLPASVSPPLARAVTRCLAKDPADRFADGRALAVALEDGLASLARSDLTELLARALTAARGDDPLAAHAAPATADVKPNAPAIDLRRVARDLGLVLVLMGAGFFAIHALDDRNAGEGEGVPENASPGTARRDAGLVRVVAHPWADVYVDGERIDVTPIGRPIAVSPGSHFVTFRHPNAPDEQRSIRIAAGQSVFLDVTMRIDRGDAGVRDASTAPASP